MNAITLDREVKKRLCQMAEAHGVRVGTDQVDNDKEVGSFERSRNGNVTCNPSVERSNYSTPLLKPPSMRMRRILGNDLRMEYIH